MAPVGIVRVALLTDSKSIAVGTASSWKQTVLVNVLEPTERRHTIHTIIDFQPAKCCLNSGKLFTDLCDSV